MVILQAKKISLLGFPLNQEQMTLESPSISIARKLLNEGCFLTIHDPKVKVEQINKDLDQYKYFDNSVNVNQELFEEGCWNFTRDLRIAAKNSDAIVILTEWDEYKNIDWLEISSLMRKPNWIFDTRRVLNAKMLRKSDINIWQLGEGFTVIKLHLNIVRNRIMFFSLIIFTRPAKNNQKLIENLISK